ncbi:MAG: hypothetical protein ACK5LX_11475 [Oscillospiraceae bacterium]
MVWQNHNRKNAKLPVRNPVSEHFLFGANLKIFRITPALPTFCRQYGPTKQSYKGIAQKKQAIIGVPRKYSMFPVHNAK